MNRSALNISQHNQQDLSGETFKRLMADEAGFVLLSDYLKQEAGISMPLTPKNLSLMAGRISSLLRKNNFENYKQLYIEIQNGNNAVANEFICSLTTNTTHWFRESQHFVKLEEYIISLIDNGHTDELKIWCAASSIGHEPYTLSIVISEAIKKTNKKVSYKILATDIDQEVLQKAASACYTQTELNGLADEQIKKYLDQKSGKFSKYFRVKPELANNVHFAKLNLLDSKYPFKGQFDVIFCRNVFIYFEKEVTHGIVEKMAPFVKSSGLLFLGHAEAGVMQTDSFKSIAHAVYERR